MSADTLCWTDIPVTNLDRAINFYSAVLGQEVSKMSEGGIEYGLLPHEEQNASGCLCVASDSAGSDNKPSHTGPLMYRSVEGRLDDAGKAVRGNGGKVLKKKTTNWAARFSRRDCRFRRQPHRFAFVGDVSRSS